MLSKCSYNRRHRVQEHILTFSLVGWDEKPQYRICYSWLYLSKWGLAWMSSQEKALLLWFEDSNHGYGKRAAIWILSHSGELQRYFCLPAQWFWSVITCLDNGRQNLHRLWCERILAWEWAHYEETTWNDLSPWIYRMFVETTSRLQKLSTEPIKKLSQIYIVTEHPLLIVVKY